LRKIQQLSSETAVYNIGIMKITKNIGMFLLAIYLIVDGLLGFGPESGFDDFSLVHCGACVWRFRSHRQAD